MINVITRTSNRPIFFSQNHQSLKNQTYKNWKHIVSYDDESTRTYIKPYVEENEIKAIAIPRPLNVENLFPYNLYCNILMREVKDGWIMFLDDDDLFMDERSLETIVKHIKDENDLLLWKVAFPNRIIPTRMGKTPKLGDVSAIGFLFHHKHIDIALWDAQKGSDYRVIYKLYKKLNPIWIDEVLTRVNYDVPRSHGSGQRLDKE
jgi:glycosyltransferase involved in cell wall biosynthesis